MCTVALTANSMPTHHCHDDTWKRSLEYTYYAPPPPSRTMALTPTSAMLDMAYASSSGSTSATMGAHHQQHHNYAHMYQPSYPSPQYYTYPDTTSSAYSLQSNATTSTTSTTASTTSSYTDMLALSIGDADFDDVRMLQEMLLTPLPMDHDNARDAHATLMFQSPFSRPQTTPHVSMPAISTSTPATVKTTTTTATTATRPLTPHSDLSSNESHATPSNAPRLARSRSRAQRKVPSTRICRVPECNKGIRSRGLCKAHGGGRRCQTPGCAISDQGGGHCIAHGGGKRCTIGGCDKSAQFKGLCKVHGGSRRCRVVDCDKNGQIKGLCRQHYTQSVHEHGGDHGDNEY